MVTDYGTEDMQNASADILSVLKTSFVRAEEGAEKEVNGNF